MQEIKIATNEAGQRFDKFLGKLLKEAPKSFLYKMLRKKNIVLNGKKSTGNEILAEGDLVKLFLADETIEKFSGEVALQMTNVSLEILYEDQDVLLINKPAGMLSQKATPSDESVVEHVISYLIRSKQITKESLKTFRPSICNRLDRNTTGIITAAKSLKGAQVLSECFKNRSIGKYYLALVAGSLEKEQHIKGYLFKDEHTNKVTITEKEREGNSYIETSYLPLWHKENTTLLEVHLITGKPHQIRAHLSYVGHPIMGDYKYGDKKLNQQYKAKYGLEAQLLHAYRLQFPDTLEELKDIQGMEVKAPLPDIFEKITKDIQGK